MATTALAASRLGTHVALITRLGMDVLERPAWRLIQKAGLDLSGCEIRNAEATAVTVCISLKDERMMITHEEIHRDFEAILDLPRVLALMRRARHVHFACAFRQPKRIRRCLADLARRGITVSADIGWNPDTLSLRHLQPLLGHLDFIFPNLLEAQHLTGESEAEKACLALARVVKIPVVKLGRKGSLMAARNAAGEVKILRSPAIKLGKVVDVTGAGDAFNGGFLHAFLRGWRWPQCLELGNYCGARAVGAAGGAAGLQQLTRHDGQRARSLQTSGMQA